MIVGIGVDVVDVARFTESVRRTPGLLGRLLSAEEQEGLRPEQLAGRFAVKEAVAKALATPGGLAWHDLVVTGEGPPRLALSGTVEALATERGVRQWHVSISHDAGVAVAMVVAES